MEPGPLVRLMNHSDFEYIYFLFFVLFSSIFVAFLVKCIITLLGLSIKVYAQNRPQRVTFQVLGIIHEEIK